MLIRNNRPLCIEINDWKILLTSYTSDKAAEVEKYLIKNALKDYSGFKRWDIFPACGVDVIVTNVSPTAKLIQFYIGAKGVRYGY